MDDGATQNVGESIAAVVNMDMQAVTPDALWELGLSLKTLVGKVEARLCDVNKASETWPMSFEMWAPEFVGPQIEVIMMPTVECVQPSAGDLQEVAG